MKRTHAIYTHNYYGVQLNDIHLCRADSSRARGGIRTASWALITLLAHLHYALALQSHDVSQSLFSSSHRVLLIGLGHWAGEALLDLTMLPVHSTMAPVKPI